MIIDSSKLGPMDIPEDKVIRLEKPILGFEQLSSFCLVEVEELAPFLWLQSVDEPSVAFLVTNPRTFYPEYRIEVNPREVAELKIDNTDDVETWVIVTLDGGPDEASVNLQGPILVNTTNQRAKQLVLVNTEYKVKHKLMDAVKTMGQPEMETYAEPVSA